MTQPVPVTVVAGFLGAGKTTLLNGLLKQASGRRLAVLVNDFGTLDIDRSLIAEVTDNVHALTNGCICCSMQGELIDQIGELATRKPAPEHILIECSGVSDPTRIVRTLGYPELRRVARLDSVTTVVDAATLTDLDDEFADLAHSQIGAADLLLLNKTDLVARGALHRLYERWLPDNRPIVETVQSRVSPGLILDSARERLEISATADDPISHHGFDTWVLNLPGTLDLRALRDALARTPSGVFRVKGYVALAERPDTLFWLHAVGGRTDIREVVSPEGMQANRIAVIARAGSYSCDAFRRDLEDCLSAP